MKRGHYIIIGGAALFVAGIVVVIFWAIPVAQKIQNSTTILQGEVIEERGSVSVLLNVTNIDRTLSIIINSREQNIPLNVVLYNPNSTKVLESKFTENNVLSANPAMQGRYNLTVANDGESPATIDVIFGYIPGVEANNQVDPEAFQDALIGSAIMISGIFVMIGGVVVAVIDNRRRSEIGKTTA